MLVGVFKFPINNQASIKNIPRKISKTFGVYFYICLILISSTISHLLYSQSDTENPGLEPYYQVSRPLNQAQL